MGSPILNCLTAQEYSGSQAATTATTMQPQGALWGKGMFAVKAEGCDGSTRSCASFLHAISDELNLFASLYTSQKYFTDQL